MPNHPGYEALRGPRGRFWAAPSASIASDAAPLKRKRSLAGRFTGDRAIASVEPPRTSPRQTADRRQAEAADTGARCRDPNTHAPSARVTRPPPWSSHATDSAEDSVPVKRARRARTQRPPSSPPSSAPEEGERVEVLSGHDWHRAHVEALVPAGVKVLFDCGAWREVVPWREVSDRVRRSRGGTEDTRECSICLEVVAPSDRAVCCPRGHSYHQHCVKEWFCESKKDACPTCGAKISRRQMRLGTGEPPPPPSGPHHTN